MNNGRCVMSIDPTWHYVVDDMLKRNAFGAEKYNRYLDRTCPDNMLQHAYEEALDLAVYLKTEILKKEHEKEVNMNLPLDLGYANVTKVHG